MGASVDNDQDFTDDFCGFLQRCVANVDTAEILLALFKHPERWWSAPELCAQLAPVASLSVAEMQRYLEGFASCGLVAADGDRGVRYRPSAGHDSHMATLARLYLARPVTLFRVIYALRDTKITTFADAFKLWR